MCVFEGKYEIRVIIFLRMDYFSKPTRLRSDMSKLSAVEGWCRHFPIISRPVMIRIPEDLSFQPEPEVAGLQDYVKSPS